MPNSEREGMPEVADLMHRYHEAMSRLINDRTNTYLNMSLPEEDMPQPEEDTPQPEENTVQTNDRGMLFSENDPARIWVSPFHEPMTVCETSENAPRFECNQWVRMNIDVERLHELGNYTAEDVDASVLHGRRASISAHVVIECANGEVVPGYYVILHGRFRRGSGFRQGITTWLPETMLEAAPEPTRTIEYMHRAIRCPSDRMVDVEKRITRTILAILEAKDEDAPVLAHELRERLGEV